MNYNFGTKTKIAECINVPSFPCKKLTVKDNGRQNIWPNSEKIFTLSKCTLFGRSIGRGHWRLLESETSRYSKKLLFKANVGPEVALLSEIKAIFKIVAFRHTSS